MSQCLYFNSVKQTTSAQAISHSTHYCYLKRRGIKMIGNPALPEIAGCCWLPDCDFLILAALCSRSLTFDLQISQRRNSKIIFGCNRHIACCWKEVIIIKYIHVCIYTDTSIRTGLSGRSVFPAEQPSAFPQLCKYFLPQLLGFGREWRVDGEVRDCFVSLLLLRRREGKRASSRRWWCMRACDFPFLRAVIEISRWAERC